MKKILLTILVAMVVTVGCKQGCKKSDDTNQILGSYATDNYAQRSEGTDWVGVIVTPDEGNNIHISICSRSDIKKPTCTFDGIAKKINDITYKIDLGDGAVALLTFEENNLIITPEKEEDVNALFFYCSGGATIAGVYERIEGNLDVSQLKKKSEK